MRFSLCLRSLKTLNTLAQGLYLIINNTFSCKICLGIINPLVIFARCCKNILGCEMFVDNLYGGENGTVKRCPLYVDLKEHSQKLAELMDWMISLKALSQCLAKVMQHLMMIQMMISIFLNASLVKES